MIFITARDDPAARAQALKAGAVDFLLLRKEKKELDRNYRRWRACIQPEFFAESIINPNAVIDPDAKKLGYVGENGKSKMPDYNNVLTIKQVANLAAYIASLKGLKPNEHTGH